MAGKKDITLLNKRGLPINRSYRYKSLKSAVKKATVLALGLHSTVQIWHLSAGKELALVRSTKDLVRIHIPRTLTFYKYWAK